MTKTIKIPERLINAFSKDGVIAFVGAGISMNAGLPSWRKLLDMLFHEVKDQLDKAEISAINKHLDGFDFLLVADYLKSRLGEIRYKDFIQETFDIKSPSKLHELILSIPFKGIVTTNYDEILSFSDKNHSYGFPISWDDDDVLRKTKKPFVLHAHGKVSNPGGTIISSTDYANLSFAGSNSLFWEAIQNLFINRKILFLGYSLNDPDLNLFLSKLQFLIPGNRVEHFVLIVGKDEDKLTTYRLKNLLGITPIFLSSDDIGKATFEWLETLKSELQSPKIVTPIAPVNYSVKFDSRLSDLKKGLSKMIFFKFSNAKDVVLLLRKFDPKVSYCCNDESSLLNNFINKLSDGELRKFLLLVIANGISDPLIIQTLSYLSIE